MTISLNPQALVLHWTTLFTLIGGGLSVAWLMRRSSLFGLSSFDAYSVAIKSVLWAIVGARLFHIIDYADFYFHVPFEMLYVWNGGLALWGAIIVGGAGALWHAKRAGANLRPFADSAAFAGMATIVFGRLGDFLSGERIGTATSLPWGVVYSDPRSMAFGFGKMHPVPLYEALLVGALLFALWRWGSPSRHGMVLLAALVGYSAIRFALGFVTVQRTYLGLDFAQWVAIAVVLGVGIWWWRWGRAVRGQELPLTPPSQGGEPGG